MRTNKNCSVSGCKKNGSRIAIGRLYCKKHCKTNPKDPTTYLICEKEEGVNEEFIKKHGEDEIK